MEHGLYLFLPAVMDFYGNIRGTCSSCTNVLSSFSHERKSDRADETGGIADEKISKRKKGDRHYRNRKEN